MADCVAGAPLLFKDLSDAALVERKESQRPITKHPWAPNNCLVEPPGPQTHTHKGLGVMSLVLPTDRASLEGWRRGKAWARPGDWGG